MPVTIEKQIKTCYAATHRAADLITKIESVMGTVDAPPAAKLAALEDKVRELSDCLREANALAIALQRRAVGLPAPQEG